MRYLFTPMTNSAATHQRLADGVTGILHSIPDTATVLGPPPAFVDGNDYELITDPQPTVETPVAVLEELPDIPTSVANWRAKAVAELLGIKSQVDAIIDTLPGVEGVVVRYAWYGGGDVSRSLIDAFAPLLNPIPTAAQLDAWMVQAAGLLSEDNTLTLAPPAEGFDAWGKPLPPSELDE